jgi:hypothetical protein
LKDYSKGGRSAPFKLFSSLSASPWAEVSPGYSAKKIMDVLSIEKAWVWTIVYILLVTLIWPLAVLFVSFFFGQFKFFRAYVTRLGKTIGVVRSSPLAVQSSESGANITNYRLQPANFSEGVTTHHSPLTTPLVAEGLRRRSTDPPTSRSSLPVPGPTRKRSLIIFAIRLWSKLP